MWHIPSPRAVNGASVYVPAANGPSGNAVRGPLGDGEALGVGAAVVAIVALGVGL
jgi:hypothetical protein